MARIAGSSPYELLLGLGTYEIFAAHWPHDVGPIADHLNSTRKHVASTTLEQTDWNNSTLITGDIAEYVAALKREEGSSPRNPGGRRPTAAWSRRPTRGSTTAGLRT